VGDAIRVIFQTDHGQLLIGNLPAVELARGWRSDPLAALSADLASDPVTGPLIEGSAPDGPIRGTLEERYFFRRAAGPGWALVGDAGHHKEFVLGDGITEALIQARSLARAIRKDTTAALVQWWRERDVEALPLYFFGRNEGALGAPRQLESIVFEGVAAAPELRRRMAEVMEHRINPFDVVPVGRVLTWTLAAALRGRLGVVSDFVAMGRFGATVAREWAARKRLLEQVR